MSKSEKSFVIVTNDNDWEGLHVDGSLVFEGHKIPRRVLLEAVGVDVSTVVAEIDGSLPDSLEEVTPA